jgi:GT2 family glycosyltransferase
MTGARPAPPRYTVVIITRDRRIELEHTLGRMTVLPGAPPLIVVDNASGDGSAAAAERYAGVLVIRAPANLGAAGRNLAVERVTTPYVAFCDDDTWWEPEAPGRAAALLDAHPRLASVTGLILVEPGGREDPITPELRCSPVPAPGWLPGPALLSILAGASMLRVSAFRAAGGFSPRLWLGGEEELLALDLATAGWWLCWHPGVVVHHAPSVARDPAERRMLGIRNTLWTAWLRRPVPGAARHTLAVLRSVPRDRASGVAVARAVRGLPWVLRERRVIPPAVEAGIRLLEAPRRASPARRYIG